MGGNLQHQERILADYVRLYPQKIAQKAKQFQIGDLGPFLEDCLKHVATLLVVVAAARSAVGDAGAIAALSDLRKDPRSRGEGESSGTLLDYINCLKKCRDVAGSHPLFDPETTLSVEDMEASTSFYHTWQKLRGEFGDPERWDPGTLSDDLIQKLGNEVNESDAKPWQDLMLCMVECRNKLKHAGLGSNIDRVPRTLMELALSAALELGVAAPTVRLLERFRLGVKGRVDQDPFGTVFFRYDTSSGEFGVAQSDMPAGPESSSSDIWVIELVGEAEAAIPGMRTVRWAKPVGRWRTIPEVVSEASPSRSVRFSQRGEAWLCAGVAGVMPLEGEFGLLPLPTTSTVVATLEGESSANCDNLIVELTGNLPGALKNDVTTAVRRTIAGLNVEPGPASAILPGMVGKVRLMRSDSPPCGLLGLRQAAVVATSRAVASSVGRVLPNKLQVGILRQALGEAWRPYRDYFGWVGSTSGSLLGERLPCPDAGLLLLVPEGDPQRRRVVDLSSVPFDLEESGLMDFQGLAASCRRATAWVEQGQPNPLLPLVRPLAKQFRAAATLVSLDTWTVGLLFERDDDHQREAAFKHLRARKLPSSIRLVMTSTAATA